MKRPTQSQMALAKTKEKAKELVREIFVEDFRQHPTKKTIDEIAEKLARSIHKKVA